MLRGRYCLTLLTRSVSACVFALQLSSAHHNRHQPRQNGQVSCPHTHHCRELLQLGQRLLYPVAFCSVECVVIVMDCCERPGRGDGALLNVDVI